MELEEAIKELESLSPSETAIETVLEALKKLTEERNIYKKEHDKITKALNFKEGSLNPPAEVCIERLKKALENSIPKNKLEDKIEELNEEFNKYEVDINCSQDDYYELSDRYAFVKEKLKELLEEKN